MSPLKRTLKWRVLKRGHWLDFVEERREREPVSYVGMIDEQEELRSNNRGAAGIALIVLGASREMRSL